MAEAAGWRDKRILITGGAGYLAGNIVALLAQEDCRIRRLDRAGAAFPAAAGKAHIEDITGDVRDRAMWESVVSETDVIFHLAAQTSVRVAQERPSEDFAINVLPVGYLVEACIALKRSPVVVFAGTVTECGLPSQLPVDESAPDRPITIYDLHKLTAESYLKQYAALGVVRGVTLRMANVYGPGPRSSSRDRGVLNMMVRKALAGEALSIYGDGDFLRDYVYVEDVARAFVLAAGCIEELNGRHFVIGSGSGYTLAQAIHLVAERAALKTGGRISVVHVDQPAGQSPIESRNFVADSRRFSQLTGWQAQVSLLEGIDRTVACFLADQKHPG